MVIPVIRAIAMPYHWLWQRAHSRWGRRRGAARIPGE